MKPGKAYTVDVSTYVIKCYTDFVLFATGKIDWASFVDKMYESIVKFRYEALYTAFTSMDSSLPSDMKLSTPVTEATKDTIIAQCEAVSAATGCEVMLVGTKVAISKLQNTVNYNMWSDEMKNERYQNGILGKWEGYETLALPRVNKTGTRTEATDNTKIFIVPVDPSFKPIKHITSGEVFVFESGMDGMKKDMTIDTEIAFQEGIAIVINQLYGVIEIQ